MIFSLLPKRGNSNWEERKKIMERFIRLFGAECIDCLVADREFIGKEWTGWLNSRRIRYYIRIRQNFWIVKPSTGERIRAWWLFNDLKVGQEKFFHTLFLHKGEYVYLAGSRIKNSDGVPELQILICFNRPEEAILTYKKRWEIETAFRAMKSSGFNIEDTHMRDMDRIARLVAMVCMALVWAYLVGEHKDINIKPIRILKHGRKAKSLVKYGLEEISTILMRPTYTQNSMFSNFCHVLNVLGESRSQKISGKSFHYLSAVSKWINTRTFLLGDNWDQYMINTNQHILQNIKISMNS